MASRPWQIHLSTLIVFVILFGAILGMHIQPRVQRLDGPLDVMQYTQYGYPLIFSERWESRSINASGGGVYFNPVAAAFNLILVLVPCLLFERCLKARDGSEHYLRLLRPHVLPLILSIAISYMIVRANASIDFDTVYMREHSTIVNLHRGWPQPTYHLLAGTLNGNVLSVGQNGKNVASSVLEPQYINTGFVAKAFILRLANLQFSLADLLRNGIAGVMIVFTTLVSSEWYWRRRIRKLSQ